MWEGLEFLGKGIFLGEIYPQEESSPQKNFLGERLPQYVSPPRKVFIGDIFPSDLIEKTLLGMHYTPGKDVIGEWVL